MFDGEGIAMLAGMFPQRKFFGIDPFIEDGYTSHVSGVAAGGALSQMERLARNHVRPHPNVELMVITASDFEKSLDQRRIDAISAGVVFVDGDHHKCREDLSLARRLIVHPHGIIAVDDLHVPDVRKSVDEAVAEFKFGVAPVGGGVILSVA